MKKPMTINVMVLKPKIMKKQGRYFIDFLKSFALGNPDITEVWKRFITEEENHEMTVVAFTLPQKNCGELIENIEKLLQDKLK
jgi:hypothetical protein